MASQNEPLGLNTRNVGSLRHHQCSTLSGKAKDRVPGLKPLCTNQSSQFASIQPAGHKKAPDQLWADSDAIDLQRRTSPKSPKTKREQIDAG
jgi:hypothetical protein